MKQRVTQEQIARLESGQTVQVTKEQLLQILEYAPHDIVVSLLRVEPGIYQAHTQPAPGSPLTAEIAITYPPEDNP